MERIQQQANFGDDSERDDILDVYREGMDTLRKRLSR